MQFTDILIILIIIIYFSMSAFSFERSIAKDYPISLVDSSRDFYLGDIIDWNVFSVQISWSNISGTPNCSFKIQQTNDLIQEWIDVENLSYTIETTDGSYIFEKPAFSSKYLNLVFDKNDATDGEITISLIIKRTKDSSTSNIDSRLNLIETTQVKVAYYAEITATSGQISIPNKSQILLNQWANNVDAVLSAIPSGADTKPDYEDTGLDCTLDIDGNYTVSGTLPTVPSAIIFFVKTGFEDFRYLDLNRFADNPILLTVTNPIDYILFNTEFTDPTPSIQGRVSWSLEDYALNVGTLNGSVLSVGQEMYLLVRNTTGATISDGSTVYYTGTTGNSGRILVGKYIANNTISSDLFLGLTTHDIPHNSDGLVTVFGKVRGFNSAAFTDGNTLYCSPSAAGGVTNVIPSAPNNVIEIGYVIHAHNNGTILVNPRHNPKFKDLQDVNGTPLNTSGQIAIWNQTSGFFDFTENINNYIKSLTQGKLDSLVVSKLSGKGILVDTTTPTFAWKDLIGDIVPKTTGLGAPTLDNWYGIVRAFRYSAGDDGDLTFHIPHDWLPSSQAFIHIHWGHNGTAISGTFQATLTFTYANRTLNNPAGTFGAVKTAVVTVSSLNIINTPQYSHRVDEIPLTSIGGSASTLDSSIIEVDGLIEMHYDIDIIPTISGGVGNEPYLFTIDIHYQTTGVLGTKSKDPDYRV